MGPESDPKNKIVEEGLEKEEKNAAALETEVKGDDLNQAAGFSFNLPRTDPKKAKTKLDFGADGKSSLVIPKDFYVSNQSQDKDTEALKPRHTFDLPSFPTFDKGFPLSEPPGHKTLKNGGLKYMDEMVRNFKKLDPLLKNQFLSAISSGAAPREKIKRETFADSEGEDRAEFTPRRQSKYRCSAKDLAAYAAIVHSYSGEEDKYTVHDFFYAIEKLARAQDLNKDAMLYVAQNKLKDKVLQFARRAKLLEIESYLEFKKALIQRFEVSIDEKEARYRFFNAQMKNSESVADFEQRIELDAEAAISKDWDYFKQQSMREVLDDQKLEVFLEGLPKDLYNVRYRNPKDISEAVKFAKQEEKSIGGRKRRFGIDTEFNQDFPGKGAKNSALPKISVAHQHPKEPTAQNKYTEYQTGANTQGLYGEINIPIRECMQNPDENVCCCHLKRQATTMIQIYETRLCTKECRFHNSQPPRFNNAPKPNNWQNKPRGNLQGGPTQQPQTQGVNAGDHQALALLNPLPDQNNFLHNSNAAAPQYNQGESGQGACLTCGRHGHARRNCRLYNAVCYNCNKPGHISRVCRLPPSRPQVAHQAIPQINTIESLEEIIDQLRAQFKTAGEVKHIATEDNLMDPKNE
jgi:Zinc knuckle